MPLSSAGRSVAAVDRRDFAGDADLRAMQRMCSRWWSPTSRFHPGQLAWSRHHRPVDPSAPADEAISLWVADDEVVGFGWAEAPEWFELQVDPRHPEVADSVIEWFEEWSDADEQSTMAVEGDIVESALIAAGFATRIDEPFFVHHVIDLVDLGAALTVEGYRFRQVEPGEAATRAECHAAAWSTLAHPSAVTPQSYGRLMQTWPYRHDLDWVAVDETGQMVASSLVWLDPDTGVGLVEPVGCVPEHRGRGLAGAVVTAGLRALRGAGASRATVTPRGDAAYPGPMRLYRSLGFRPTARIVTWTRSLG